MRTDIQFMRKVLCISGVFNEWKWLVKVNLEADSVFVGNLR
ncbi:hypothetical protein ACWF7H_02565 [Peribacillus butanolivorans]